MNQPDPSIVKPPTIASASVLSRLGLVRRSVLRTHPATFVVIAGVLLYSVAFSLRSIANYRTYHMLFDMAVFEQSFWNGSQGRFFQNSLEIAGNHFATHFSPIFFLMLPFYTLKPSPPTLLVLQSIALAVAALPLYAIARRRLANAWLAAVIAFCYLLTPAIMDINTVNDWHEIAFVVPCLMTAYYFALRIRDSLKNERWLLVGYAVAILLALMTKEDQGFTVAAFGLWVVLACRRWRLGLATIAVAIAYTLLAILVFVPIYRGNAPYVPVNAYPELGTTLPQIIGTIFGNPAKVVGLLTWPDKVGYVEWLLLPLGFLSLLAPEVLLVAVPALFINIAASNPAFFTIYERYTAPLVPTFFVAAVVGITRLGTLVRWLSQRTAQLKLKPYYGIALGVAILALATFNAQATLKRIPTDFNQTPSAHAQLAIAIIEKIPQGASFAPADNRMLVYGAHRNTLAYLNYDTMLSDYVLFDDAQPPITPTSPAEIADIKTILSRKYQIVYQEDGLLLLADKKAFKRDQAVWQK